MTSYAVLLRGINVGTHNRVSMTDVRAALARAGLAAATTYLQSGNIVVSDARQRGPIEALVEKAMNSDLKLKGVVAIARRSSELTKIVAIAHPLTAPNLGPKALHVGFLKRAPAAAGRKALASLEFGAERFLLKGTELYLAYPDGQGRSKMTGAALERALGVPLTVRGWNVTTKLCELSQ